MNARAVYKITAVDIRTGVITGELVYQEDPE